MGGTSTDLSLYSGELPRRYLSRDRRRAAAGPDDGHPDDRRRRRLDRALRRRPAAGRSRVRRRRSRPACYRRGGPATITDCNLVLGRIQAGWFPRGVRPAGRCATRRGRLAAMPGRDRSAGRRRLGAASRTSKRWRRGVHRRRGRAHELCRARARATPGQDPAQFALLCFGGAAGQHACAVAEALGCREILLHRWPACSPPWASAITTRTLRCDGGRSRRALDQAAQPRPKPRWPNLASDAREPLLRQGSATAQIETRRRRSVRLPGPIRRSRSPAGRTRCVRSSTAFEAPAPTVSPRQPRRARRRSSRGGRDRHRCDRRRRPAAQLRGCTRPRRAAMPGSRAAGSAFRCIREPRYGATALTGPALIC